MSKRIFVIMEVPMSMSSAWCLRAMLLFSTLALLSLFHAHRFVVLQMPRDNNLTVESLLTNNFKNKNNKQPTLVDRIYYINMNVSRGRRQAMEQWLGNRTMNTIPFQRVEGQMGDGSKGICDLGKKQDPKRCAGISGLARTNIHIMDHLDTTGNTLVMEDDWIVHNMTALLESLALVPSDWDIVRWNCWGTIRPTMPVYLNHTFINGWNMTVFRTAHSLGECNDIEACWFCGGTHLALWKDSSVQKIRTLWNRQPYDDIDCRLTNTSINSYCVNFEDVPEQVAEIVYVNGEKSYISEADQDQAVVKQQEPVVVVVKRRRRKKQQ